MEAGADPCPSAAGTPFWPRAGRQPAAQPLSRERPPLPMDRPGPILYDSYILSPLSAKTERGRWVVTVDESRAAAEPARHRRPAGASLPTSDSPISTWTWTSRSCSARAAASAPCPTAQDRRSTGPLSTRPHPTVLSEQANITRHAGGTSVTSVERRGAFLPVHGPPTGPWFSAMARVARRSSGTPCQDMGGEE